MTLANTGLTNTVDNAAATWGSVSGSINSQTDLYQGLAGIVTIDMENADYTMTPSEALAYTKILTNVGDGTKTLTWPSGSDNKDFATQFIAMLLATNTVTLALQSGGVTCQVHAGDDSDVLILPGLGIYSIVDIYAAQINATFNGVASIGDATINLNNSYGGELINGTRATPQTIVINSATSFNPGFRCDVLCSGAGGITVTVAGTFTLTGDPAIATNGKKTIYRDGATNSWYVG